MTNNDLIDALRNQIRQPVDLNLGQVPVSPTIGRMGNYNVVVPGYSTRNAATELSSALAQFPQILGQARNLQEKAGAQAANELTTEQVIERVKDGDYEAEGFLTQFGKDKAFAEQVYQRWFKSQIQPSLIKASSELDNKSHDDLLKMGEGEEFRSQVKSLLVSSLTNNDPSILEKIADNPYTARLHNKAMEAYIPEFIAKAEATATARKLKFTKDAALQSVTDDVISGTDFGPIPEFSRDETLSDIENKNNAEKYYTAQRDTYVEVFQAGLDSAMVTASTSGLEGADLNQARKNALAGLESRMGYLLEREDTQEYGAVLTAMRDGIMKVDGASFSSFKEGVDLMTKAEYMLERYEDKLDAENEREDYDPGKVSTWLLDNVYRPINEVTSDLQAPPQELQEQIQRLSDLKSTALQLPKEKASGREITTYLQKIDDQIDELEVMKDKRVDYITFVQDSPEFGALTREVGLGDPATIKTETQLGQVEFEQRAREFDFEPELAFFARQGQHPVTGDPVTTYDIDLDAIPAKARLAALRQVVGPEFTAYREGNLILDDNKRSELQTAYKKAYASKFKDLMSELAREKGYSPSATPKDTEGPTGRVSPEFEESLKSRRIEKQGYPLENGRLQYESAFFAADEGISPAGLVDTDNAYKMVVDAEAVEIMKNSNTEAERLQFNKRWLYTKFRKFAQSARAKAIMQKPAETRLSAKAWEIQQSEVTGLPMEILKNDRGFSKTTYMKDNGFLAFDTEEPFEIDYDRGGSLTNKDAPEKRIFNVNAVYKATRLNDFEDLIFIATEYGHAPKGADAKSPEIQSFLNKQKVLISKYGFMDFRRSEKRKTFEPPKEKTLEDYSELYDNSAITDPAPKANEE